MGWLGWLLDWLRWLLRWLLAEAASTVLPAFPCGPSLSCVLHGQGCRMALWNSYPHRTDGRVIKGGACWGDY